VVLAVHHVVSQVSFATYTAGTTPDDTFTSVYCTVSYDTHTHIHTHTHTYIHTHTHTHTQGSDQEYLFLPSLVSKNEKRPLRARRGRISVECISPVTGEMWKFNSLFDLTSLLTTLDAWTKDGVKADLVLVDSGIVFYEDFIAFIKVS
jgi:hypothetical protein